MILKIASNDSYTKEDHEKLKPFVGKPITLEQLVALPVAVAIAQKESVDGYVAIDHPYSW